MSVIPARPLEFGEILDTAFGLFRRDYRLYMPLALVGLVPATLAVARMPTEFLTLSGMLADPGQMVLILGPLALGMIFSLLTWSALIGAMEARNQEYATTIGQCYARAAVALPKLALAAFFAGLLLLAGFTAVIAFAAISIATVGVAVTFVLGLLILLSILAITTIWMSHFCMLMPAVVIEGHGPFGALSRSFRLLRGRRLRSFGIIGITFLISFIPGLASSLVSSGEAIFSANPAETLGPIRYWVTQGISLGISSVTTPIVCACVLVLYSDLKVRGEGADLEAAARAISG